MTYKLIDIDESYCQLESDDIQFKKKVIDTLSVFEDGYKFSALFRAGVWDGKKHFYTIESNTNIQFPKGLVSYIIKDLHKHNYQYEYNPISTNFKLDFEVFTDFVKTLGLPFEPYDYQLKAAHDMLTLRRLTLRSATSSGKSLIAYLFFRYMLANNMNSLLVVPSINLVDQMFTDFEDYGFKDAGKYIKQIGGDHKGSKDLSEKPIVISTWQSLIRMSANEFKIFDGIVIDEAHSAKSDCLDSIIKRATKAKWKLGMTGTIPRTRVDKLQLLGTLGRVHQVISPQGLIDRGLATPIRINALYLNYSTGDRDMLNKGQKPDYIKETKFIAEHYYRNLKVAQILIKLAKTGNVLGTFAHIAHGEKLLKMCIELRTGKTNVELLHKITPKPLQEAFEKWESNSDLNFYMNTPITLADKKKILKNLGKITTDDRAHLFLERVHSLDEINIFLITGAVSGATREYIRKNLETIDNSKTDEGAIILGGWSVVSTGVNFKNLHSIVYMSSLKSYTKIVQSIGRGMRLHKSKSMVQIYDIVDILTSNNQSERPNYVLKHFYERLEYYREDGYPIAEKEIILEGDTKSHEIKNFMEEW
jgi:superfamily II DNA or RNA helicase